MNLWDEGYHLHFSGITYHQNQCRCCLSSKYLSQSQLTSKNGILSQQVCFHPEILKHNEKNQYHITICYTPNVLMWGWWKQWREPNMSLKQCQAQHVHNTYKIVKAFFYKQSIGKQENNTFSSWNPHCFVLNVRF